jgi:hypothetical protein
MKEAKDNDDAPFHAINDHVRRTTHNQFSRGRDAAWPTEVIMIGQSRDHGFDSIADLDGSPGISFSNMGKLTLSVLFGDR